MSVITPNQSAAEVHTALKSALQTLEKAQQCAVLWFSEIMTRQLYRELGFSSINQYAEVELGFSATRTNDFVRLCRGLKKLPKMREKLANGDLGYTAARVLMPVLDETNEEDWVDFALNNSRRVLEREVKRAKAEAVTEKCGQQTLIVAPTTHPAAVVPVRTTIEMSPSQFARYEKLWEQIRKQGHAPSDKVEAMLEFMASYAGKISPRGQNSQPTKPPAQIHIHQCPTCEKSSVSTSKGELAITSNELERARCDAQISHPDQRNTTSIPPATRRKVLAHNRHQCQRPGCGHTLFLEVHHIIPRAQGGSNQPDNLTCLCSACHKLIHDGKWPIPASTVRETASIYGWRADKSAQSRGVVCSRLPQASKIRAQITQSGGAHARYDHARTSRN